MDRRVGPGPIIAQGVRREFEIEQVLPGKVLKIDFPIQSRNQRAEGHLARRREHTEFD